MKWEYQELMLFDRTWKRNDIIDPDLENKPVSEVLNLAGQEGWELAAVVHVMWTTYYFKRPVSG